MISNMLLVSTPLSVFAYLDPGSGSMLLSAIIGIVATVYFVLKSLAYKIVQLPSIIFNRRNGPLKTRDIVIYSEGDRYWNVFAPLLKELNSMGLRCTYLSSDKRDSGLDCGLEHVDTRYIGRGSRAFLVLNMLQAKICVATTPGLDVLQFKRSKGVGKYCHITHSAGGVAGYHAYGLDYYDMVLVGGDGDRRMIRDIESARNIKAKEIHVVGCTYLDVLRQALAAQKEQSVFNNNGKETILISPTWGQHGILNKSGELLLSTLIESKKFNLIVRPHPQTFSSDKTMVESLMSKFPPGDNLVWDKNADGLASMRKADIMISDFSGIIFDFIFLFNRPVISFMGYYDRRGKDAMDLPDDSWNLKALKKLGGAYKEEDIPHLPMRIDDLKKNGRFSVRVVDELRDGMDKYPGESGARAAQVIARCL